MIKMDCGDVWLDYVFILQRYVFITIYNLPSMSAFNEITLLREADTHNLKRILYELAGTKYSFNLRKLYCAPKKVF